MIALIVNDYETINRIIISLTFASNQKQQYKGHQFKK